jgi:hypothetical protein
MFKANILSSKDIKVSADNVSSYRVSSTRTVFNCRANTEQRKVSEVSSSGKKVTPGKE